MDVFRSNEVRVQRLMLIDRVQDNLVEFDGGRWSRTAIQLKGDREGETSVKRGVDCGKGRSGRASFEPDQLFDRFHLGARNIDVVHLKKKIPSHRSSAGGAHG